METKRPLSDEDSLNSGTWAVALYPAARSFIGRVHLIEFIDPYTGPGLVEGAGGKPRSEIPVEEVIRAAHVTLFPVFDFFNVTLRPVPIRGEDGKMKIDAATGTPEVGMAREPIVNALEFTCYDAPLHLKDVTCWYFFSQMDERDCASYKNFVRQAWRQQKHFRSQTSTIQPPTPTEAAAIARGHGGRRS
jgi:hypothetical protein